MIETLQDWNTRLVYCGCCEMPACPTPVVVCESRTGTATRDDFPSDSGSTATGWFLPFIDPGGADADDLPAAYCNYFRSFSQTGIGTFIIKSHLIIGPTTTQERRNVVTWTGGTLSTVRTLEINEWESSTSTCTNTFENLRPSNFNNFAGLINAPLSFICTTTSKDSETLKRIVNPAGGVTDLLGCPGPFAGAATTSGDYVYTQSTQESLTAPVTKSDLIAKALELMAATWVTGFCASLRDVDWPTIEEAKALYAGAWPACGAIVGNVPPTAPFPFATLRKVRFRFRIPTAHTGSYFKITYDIAEFPEDGDPSFVSEDNVVEWTGPGTGASTDPSWLTPWVEVEPPEVPGQRRIVNIRFTCYHGEKFGVKPQVTGEALEISPP